MNGNRQTRFGRILAVATLTLGTLAVYGYGPIVLANPEVAVIIQDLNPLGGSRVRSFDLASQQGDPQSRALAFATALVGFTTGIIGFRGKNLSQKLVMASMCTSLAAYVMPRPMFGPSFSFYFWFFNIQSLVILALPRRLYGSLSSSALPSVKLTILDLLALTILVAILLSPPVRQFFTFHDWQPHPPTSIGFPVNLWIILLGTIAGLNAALWIASFSGSWPRQFMLVLLSATFAICAGLLAPWLYRNYELFWAPNSTMGKHPWVHLYYGYVYWLCWQGVFVAALVGVHRWLVVRYRNHRKAEPCDATENGWSVLWSAFQSLARPR